MSKGWQTTSQIVFLILFIILIITGKVQLWMGIFILSVVIALFFGRFYCGWLCPINTVMKAVTALKRKFSLKSLTPPHFLTNPFIRYTSLLLFVLTFIFIMVTGQKLPILPFLLALGVALTLFFPEYLWHSYLCPYGAIFTLTGSKAKKSLQIPSDQCVKCGSCLNLLVCPGNAIKIKDNTFSIDKGQCLLCFDCVRTCPKNIIQYKLTHSTLMDTE